MATSDCTYPMPGRFLAVGIFLSDDCGQPISGPDAGYNDWCPAALAMTDDVQEGEGFTRTCANGDIIVEIPPKETLPGVDVELDLHGIDPAFAGSISGSPVTQNGEVVGWDDCQDGSGNASIYLYREVVDGNGACGGPGGQPLYLVTILPWVTNLRVTSEGTFGGDDGYQRLTGRSRTGHSFGHGAIPLFPDPTDPDANPPVCMDQEIDPRCVRRNVYTTLAPSDLCGFVDVEPCTGPE